MVPRIHHQGAEDAERLLRVPGRAAGAAVSRAAARQEDVRRRLVLHRARSRRPSRSSRRSARFEARRSTWSGRCRTRRCRACSTRSIRRACSGTGRRTSSTSSATRPSRCTSKHGVQAADDAVHDAPVPDRRRRGPREEQRHAWGYRDAKWAQVIVGVDPDPANKEKITRWARTTGGTPPLLGRRRVRELHDGGGRGSHPGDLRGELRPAGEDQEALRPGESVPREPEHQAGEVRVCSEFPTPDLFYKKESQKKTLLHRPDFFLLRSPLD